MTANNDARDVAVISDWFGSARRSETLEKVPSRIAFAHENEGIDDDKWGYEVESGMKSYSWTKLLLDTNAAATDFDSEILAGKVRTDLLDLPANMTAEEVVTAYLSHLYKHTLGRLTKVHGEAVMDVTSIDFWFTVPATWQESANYATRMAAMGAGFGSRRGDQLYMITEPEAAAMAILSQANDANPALYKVSNSFVVSRMR